MIDRVLADLWKTHGIEACAAVSRNGLLIHAIIQQEQYGKSLAAMSAAMLGAAETTIAQIGRGVPHRVIVECEYGKLIVIGAGPKALLAIIVNSDVELGLILIGLEESAKKLKGILD
ncbi:MAG: roadblock/LC7 domain-containing protein [Candidatus Methanoperedens sp.]|uniref:roadblock/LC7 domain-containing protein n=1 Tax=Candidatus Methanoperedens nitratireducens TaxID=1392998 RepID=UPI00064FEF59|nr:roadblock/LC7 domain-containing protein [Candidatus Methanoperedens nitroreducens]MDJ1421063.1 roadblock/LC7 domain-containing protein [Candidatus Methanoperedens sp.]